MAAAANPKPNQELEKDDPLKKCFTSLVEDNRVIIGMKDLRVILCDQLKMNFKILEPGLVKILPYFLAYHVKHWPGWEWRLEYRKGKLSFDAWYQAFLKSLSQKLDQAKEIYSEAILEIRNEQVKKSYENKTIVDQGSQVGQFLAKAEAPFTIEIMAKPAMLNTIVFDDHKNDDVLLKPHYSVEWLESDLRSLCTKQIFNWPHIGIHMYCPVFSFSRKNCPEYERYVSFVSNLVPNRTENFINHIEILNLKNTRTCYTINYIRKLTSDILELLKEICDNPSVIDMFQVLFEELLCDIEELQVLRDGSPTIASNTSVLFAIGKCIYFRNKKWSKGSLASLQDIVYFESIIPRMETAIIEIGSEDQIKSYIDEVKKSKGLYRTQVKLPSITFSCGFCQLHIQTIDHLMQHFKFVHKMEPPMMCSLCKKTFSALDLARDRWKHDCKKVVQKMTKDCSEK